MSDQSTIEEDLAEIEALIGPTEGPCDVCGDQDASYPGKCDGCGAAVCETCEVMKCEAGYHACPKCGARMGDCSPLLSDT